MSKGLNARWVRSCKTDEERDRAYNLLAGSQPVIEALRGIVKELATELEALRDSRPKYEDAAWPYRQAHLNGGKDVLDTLLNEVLPSDEAINELFKRAKTRGTK